jgi:hypothetical protein
MSKTLIKELEIITSGVLQKAVEIVIYSGNPADSTIGHSTDTVSVNGFGGKTSFGRWSVGLSQNVGKDAIYVFKGFETDCCTPPTPWHGGDPARPGQATWGSYMSGHASKLAVILDYSSGLGLPTIFDYDPGNKNKGRWLRHVT